ncbi:carbonic anhydrase family protein [Lacibacter sp. H375]|uniref:carbonic anhydrase family protein n=1 Tax=Lacibacter sp. H375 TaxID=3133424 RepID=UPI0030C190B7
MLRLTLSVAVFTGLLSSATSCDQSSSTKTAEAELPKPLIEKVLSAEEQKALTPETVLKSLKDGNYRYAHQDLTARNHSAMVRDASQGQYPKAVILSCLDSRVPVEDVFDKGIGDLFVGRVAGNFVNEDLLGSMEYGCKVAGAKLILVLGHESCGAIKAAIENVQMGNITSMLSKIKPAVERCADYAGKKTSKDPLFVEYVAKKNVLNAIEMIKQQSPLLKEMADKGEIKIVGAYYNLHTGEVVFL